MRFGTNYGGSTSSFCEFRPEIEWLVPLQKSDHHLAIVNWWTRASRILGGHTLPWTKQPSTSSCNNHKTRKTLHIGFWMPVSDKISNYEDLIDTLFEWSIKPLFFRMTLQTSPIGFPSRIWSSLALFSFVRWCASASTPSERILSPKPSTCPQVSTTPTTEENRCSSNIMLLFAWYQVIRHDGNSHEGSQLKSTIESQGIMGRR